VNSYDVIEVSVIEVPDEPDAIFRKST